MKLSLNKIHVVYSEREACSRNRQAFLVRFFLLTTVLLSAFSVVAWAAPKRFTVVIDAGHGGKDFGACRGDYIEKKINLGVALKLGNLIEQNLPDIKVVYTRKTDVFVELDKRAEIANRVKANLFISIHTNSTAGTTTSASGAETYILGLARSKENLEVAKRENSVILMEDNYNRRYEGFDPKSPESYILFEFMTNKYMEQSYDMASYVQNEFRRSTNQNDKGVRQAGFLVLRKSSMPSLLVEVGFVNNLKDGPYITSDSGQSDIARAIFNALRKYKREFDKKQGVVAVSVKNENSDEDYNSSSDDSRSFQPDSGSNGDNINSNRYNSSQRNSSLKVSANSKKTEAKGSKVVYKVQIITSPIKISKGSSQFKGLSPVELIHEKGQYKYTYGSSSDFNEILRILRDVRKKFKDAFIIKIDKSKKAN
ncbi:MAG: N-acetylmuramoyl-L-alanine amidase [Dysgonamonadaceae bacterium]